MNLGDLIQRTSLKLGEQTTFYPEAEMVASGINPAQRLLCLAYPLLLQKRVLLAINPDQVFTDLRQVTPTIRKVNRVVLGDTTVPAGAAVPTTGQFVRLLPTTLARLAGRNNWMEQAGITVYYWMHGTFWLGLWKRPMTNLTVTVLYDAIPAPMLALTDTPDITLTYHPLIADIAAGLLLCKEGMPESERGIGTITTALQSVNL
jgi:hypothetical protein